MIVFRLAKSRYCLDLSGKGAEKTGGRWNSKGTSIIYTSESRALCTAEIAVHIPLGILPKDFNLVIIEIPDSVKVKKIILNQLPQDWNSIPHSGSTQEIGDAFINEQKYAVMKVPSALVPGDFNYLINPAHPDFKKIKIIDSVAFVFDQRLFLK